MVRLHIPRRPSQLRLVQSDRRVSGGGQGEDEGRTVEEDEQYVPPKSLFMTRGVSVLNSPD